MGRRRSNWRLPDEPISRGSCFWISSEVVNNFDISTTPALIGARGEEQGGSPPWGMLHRTIPVGRKREPGADFKVSFVNSAISGPLDRASSLATRSMPPAQGVMLCILGSWCDTPQPCSLVALLSFQLNSFSPGLARRISLVQVLMRAGGVCDEGKRQEGGGPFSPPPASLGGDPHGRGYQDREGPWQGLVLGLFGVGKQAGEGYQVEPEKICHQNKSLLLSDKPQNWHCGCDPGFPVVERLRQRWDRH